MNTPIRASCFVVLPTAAFAGAAVLAAAACFLTSSFTGATFFVSCFLVSVFLVVVFFFSAIITTSQHLLQERLAADPMEIQPEVLRTHSLCQAKEFSKMKHRYAVFDAELLLDLDLAAVELELTERTDIREGIHLHVL